MVPRGRGVKRVDGEAMVSGCLLGVWVVRFEDEV